MNYLKKGNSGSTQFEFNEKDVKKERERGREKLDNENKLLTNYFQSAVSPRSPQITSNPAKIQGSPRMTTYDANSALDSLFFAPSQTLASEPALMQNEDNVEAKSTSTPISHTINNIDSGARFFQEAQASLVCTLQSPFSTPPSNVSFTSELESARPIADVVKGAIKFLERNGFECLPVSPSPVRNKITSVIGKDPKLSGMIPSQRHGVMDKRIVKRIKALRRRRLIRVRSNSSSKKFTSINCESVNISVSCK